MPETQVCFGQWLPWSMYATFLAHWHCAHIHSWTQCVNNTSHGLPGGGGRDTPWLRAWPGPLRPRPEVTRPLKIRPEQKWTQRRNFLLYTTENMSPNDNVSMSVAHLGHVLIVYNSMEHVTCKSPGPMCGRDEMNICSTSDGIGNKLHLDCFCLDIHLLLIMYKLLLIYYYYNYY